MEEENKQSPLIPPLPRDPRGSLEVFNPSTYSSRPTNPVFRSQTSWKNWAATDDHINSSIPETEEIVIPKSSNENEEIATSWMAIAPATASQKLVTCGEKKVSSSSSSAVDEVGAAAQRAAEWGLVLKTDDETGKLQGVKVRNSGDDPNGRTETSRRDSDNSVRSSGDYSDDGTGKHSYTNLSYIHFKFKYTLSIRSF